MRKFTLLLFISLALLLKVESKTVAIVEEEQPESKEIYEILGTNYRIIEKENKTVHEVLEKDPEDLKNHETVHIDFKKYADGLKNHEDEISKSLEKLECNLTPEQLTEIRGYQDRVDQIIEYVTNGPHKGKTYDTLATMVDTFGPRPVGSQALIGAIEYIQQISLDHGLENVHTEDVTVPHWVRNNESAWMTSPRYHPLNILGLGSSVGTPPDGITADVLVVKSFDELAAQADKAFGKIILYNAEFVEYFITVSYRIHGASRAARVGALASFVRSTGPFSINSPHTGKQEYDSNVHKIPSAAITLEDADMMQRMQDRGQKITVHLFMGAQNLGDIVSKNTIAEVQGYEQPQKVVTVGGNLDSWDVGQGAMDGGGGVFISWNALVVLRELDFVPRRTVRGIFVTGEEQGLYGGKAYYEAHKHESENFQLLLASGAATFNPQGLAFSGTDEATCIMQEIVKLTKSIKTTKIIRGTFGGAEAIEVWEKAGLPTGSLLNENEHYFWFHHTDGDTMSVEDSDTLDRCTAMWTAVAYVAADMTLELPRINYNSTK